MRYDKLDLFRGITLISMILYHGCWDLQYIFGYDIPGYDRLPGFFWQRSICFSFIILSGFCQGLSGHPIKRGIVVFLCGMVVTLATYIFERENVVYFGVLTFIGAAMMLFGALRDVRASIIGWNSYRVPLKRLKAGAGFLRFLAGQIRKVPKGIGIMTMLLGYLCFSNVNTGYISIFSKRIFLPDALYSNMSGAFLGFPPEDFYSSDYFPVLPWIFLFGAGYFLYGRVSEKGAMKYLTGTVSGPIEWLGRHSLVIYMLHQPVLYGLGRCMLLLIFV